MQWYDAKVIQEQIPDFKDFDCIVVDGPFSGYSPYIRYSAIPFLNNFLAKDYFICLDDSERAEEKEIAKEWKKILNFEMTDYKRYVVFTNSTKLGVRPFQI